MMTNRARAGGLTLLLSCPGALLAQADTPGAASPKDGVKGASASQGGERAGYPRAVKKQLYASNDLRGKQAPTFQVEKWLSAEPKRAGKTVLIDFWATWCGPCVELVPELIDFQRKFGEDLVVIGVSDETEEKVRTFMKEKKVSYSMAIDRAKTMSKAVGVAGIPHVLVISSDGVVRWQGYPLDDSDRLTEDVLRQIIDTDKSGRAKKDETPVSGSVEKPDKK